MGLIPLMGIEEYFSLQGDKRKTFVGTFLPMMSSYFFLTCTSMMEKAGVREKPFLMSPIVEHMQKVTKLFYMPSNSLYIDESTISFKGKKWIKVYNPKKACTIFF